MTAEVAEQVRESRKAQGLPPCITDELFLTQLAAILVSRGEEVASSAA